MDSFEVETKTEQQVANPIALDPADGEVVPTAVPHSLFRTPFAALGVNGGTAAFFKVEYAEGAWQDDTCMGAPVDSPHFWIGKDLARARDELAFYEAVLQYQGQRGWEVLDWMLPYKGIVTAPTDLGDGGEREVLLIRNARDQFATCRMLDIKIGEVTAVGGWQGKGHFDAYLQKWLDGATNSGGQGFRLEGFDAPPPSMRSVLEHAFVTAESMPAPLPRPSLERFLMQLEPANEFLKFFLDLHFTPKNDAATVVEADREAEAQAEAEREAGWSERLCELETEELVLLNCIEELAGLAAACRTCAVPQQWIGSSVMLAFDDELRPLRAALQAAQQDGGGARGHALPPGAAASIARARVHVFDWGRSELNLPDEHAKLWWEHKRKREKMWGRYCSGIGMLLYDCVLTYLRRFRYRKQSAALSVWDRDVYTADELIGLVTIPLHATPTNTATPAVTVALEDTNGKAIARGSSGEASVGYSVKGPLTLPAPTRLEHVYEITVHCATNLPKMDVFSQTDPVAHIQTFAEAQEVANSTIASLSQGFLSGQPFRSGWNGEYGTVRALLRSPGCRSTRCLQGQPNPRWRERFMVGNVKASGGFEPLIAALLKAFGGDGGLELDPDHAQVPGEVGRFVETRRSIFKEHQVVSLEKLSLSDFFPSLLEEGQFHDSSARQAMEQRFVHFCFPELDRKGFIRVGTGYRNSKERKLLFGMLVLLVLLLCWVAVDMLWLSDMAEAQVSAMGSNEDGSLAADSSDSV